VKPTAHTAKPAAAPKTGLFAALRGLLSAKGDGLPKIAPGGLVVSVRRSGQTFQAAFFSSDINKFDASGNLIAPPSPFGVGNFSSAAVNPVNGDVYVMTLIANEAGDVEINTYDPNTGASLSSFEVPASKNLDGFYTVVQIAADSAGNVYVPEPLKKK